MSHTHQAAFREMYPLLMNKDVRVLDGEWTVQSLVGLMGSAQGDLEPEEDGQVVAARWCDGSLEMSTYHSLESPENGALIVERSAWPVSESVGNCLDCRLTGEDTANCGGHCPLGMGPWTL